MPASLSPYWGGHHDGDELRKKPFRTQRRKKFSQEGALATQTAGRGEGNQGGNGGIKRGSKSASVLKSGEECFLSPPTP